MSLLRFTRVPTSKGPAVCHGRSNEREHTAESCYLPRWGTAPPEWENTPKSQMLLSLVFCFLSVGWYMRTLALSSCQALQELSVWAWRRKLRAHVFKACTPTLLTQKLMGCSRVNPWCISSPTTLTCQWDFCGILGLCRSEHAPGVHWWECIWLSERAKIPFSN